MRRQDDLRLGPEPDRRIGGQTRQVVSRIGRVPEHFGAVHDDVVKINRWYAGGSGVGDFEAAALACAARTRMARQPLWDWHVHLPCRHGLKCGEMIFLGGQVALDRKGEAVNPDDLSAQTHQAMVHIGTILNDLGADDDVCKGDCGPGDLNSNLPIRASCFPDPGPASTGIPLPVLA